MNNILDDKARLQAIIAENLSANLDKKGMSYGDFYKRTGIKPAVSKGKIRLGKKVTLDDLLNMSGVLGIGIHDLLKGDEMLEKDMKSKDLAHKIMELVGSLEMKKKKSLYGILKIL